MLNSEQNRDFIIQIFPNLQADPAFIVTSPIDETYNCIAFALKVTRDSWYWPLPKDQPFTLDGVKYDWPPGARKDENIESLLEYLQTQGYEICNDPIHEVGYRKVALFGKDSGTGTVTLTHAARQRPNGVWVSKLGKSYDIEHNNPYDLESNTYGTLYYILKLKHL